MRRGRKTSIPRRHPGLGRFYGGPILSTIFSKAWAAVPFGSLGQSWEPVEGVPFAIKREAVDDIALHRATTLKDFVRRGSDQVRKFLGLPKISTRVLQYGWRPWWTQPRHGTRPCTSSSPRRHRKTKIVSLWRSMSQGASVIRSPTWKSRGWRLAIRPGFVTFR